MPEMKKIPIRRINITPKESHFSDHFSVRDMSTSLAEKDLAEPLHRHDFFYILVIKNGSGSHDIDFVPYAVTDRSVFILRPGQVHQLTLKTGSTAYLIQFRNEFYSPNDNVSNALLRKASSLNHYQFDENRFDKLRLLLTFIIGEYNGRHEAYQEAIQANLGLFFIELIRQQTEKPTTVSSLYAQKRLEEFLGFLETNAFDHKPVSEYAAMLNLSAYQLNAITKTTLSKTCSEVINEYILLEAKRYLLATSNQITQISGHLGYEDISYFIRFFKKHTGYSPEAFRNNFK